MLKFPETFFSFESFHHIKLLSTDNAFTLYIFYMHYPYYYPYP